VEFYSKNKFEKLVHLVGFILRMFMFYQYKFQIILEAQTEGRKAVSFTVAAAGHLRYCHRLSTAFRQQDIP